MKTRLGLGLYQCDMRRGRERRGDTRARHTRPHDDEVKRLRTSPDGSRLRAVRHDSA